MKRGSGWKRLRKWHLHPVQIFLQRIVGVRAAPCVGSSMTVVVGRAKDQLSSRLLPAWSGTGLLASAPPGAVLGSGPGRTRLGCPAPGRSLAAPGLGHLLCCSGLDLERAQSLSGARARWGWFISSASALEQDPEHVVVAVEDARLTVAAGARH